MGDATIGLVAIAILHTGVVRLKVIYFTYKLIFPLFGMGKKFNFGIVLSSFLLHIFLIQSFIINYLVYVPFITLKRGS